MLQYFFPLIKKIISPYLSIIPKELESLAEKTNLRRKKHLHDGKGKGCVALGSVRSCPGGVETLVWPVQSTVPPVLALVWAAGSGSFLKKTIRLGVLPALCCPPHEVIS